VVQKQENILQTLGMGNPLVSLSQYATALQDLTRLAGFRKSDRYFKRVDPNWQPPQKQEQPDPAMLLAQAQIESIKINDNLKLEESSAKLNHEREKQRMDDDFRRDQLAQEGILKQAEIEQKYGADLAVKRLQIESEVNKHRDGLVADAFNAAAAPAPAPAPAVMQEVPTDGL
jgi:coproporphyrinogen III oxidase-like Fe-S oxidoreductase